MSRVLRPLFVTVTWGAGGSTSSRSLELAEICQRQLGLTTCLHLTCTNMRRKLVDEALDEAKAIGLRNILALRGDPPRDKEYRLDTEDGEEERDVEANNEVFLWAVDLVRYIRHRHGNYFCIGVATYPEGHADESHPAEQSPEHDLPYLIEKTKAGADFLMTQLFYDLNAYSKFEKMLREHESGVFKDIPIIPGLMPIQNYQILKRTTVLSHCKIPSALLEKLDPIKADDEAVKQVGINTLTEIIQGIKAIKSKRPRGFQFYTLNLEKVVSALLKNNDLIPPGTDDGEYAIEESTVAMDGVNGTANPAPEDASYLRISSKPSQSRRPSSVSSNRLTTSHRSSSPANATQLATNQSITTVSREATWDDFPNGRFGDARSPAFGTPTSYSLSSLPCTPAQARLLWGEPTTTAAITSLFTAHLAGHSPHLLPWSDESSDLSPETALIRPHLTALTEHRNWWTIASQPAVDGVPSTNAVHGWGPPGGFVFQKPFVEFFLSNSDWEDVLRPHLQRAGARGEASWYAGNALGAVETSEPAAAVHSVTWGSFKGKEIATATMVEEMSFRTWCEEAFGRWEQWARCCRDGRARRFLRDCYDGTWLVNVIGHGYAHEEGERLWEILREARGGSGRKS